MNGQAQPSTTFHLSVVGNVEQRNTEVFAMSEQTQPSGPKGKSKTARVESLLNDLRANSLDDLQVFVECLLEDHPEISRRLKISSESVAQATQVHPCIDFAKNDVVQKPTMTSVVRSLGVDYSNRRSLFETDSLQHKGSITLPAVDYATIDVSAEAKEGNRFDVRESCFELLAHSLFPFSVPLVYFFKGRRGVEMHSWILGGKPHETVRDHAKTISVPPSMVIAIQYIQQGIPGAILVMSLVLICVDYIPRNSPVLPDLFISFVIVFLGAAIRSLKYGFRSRSASLRLIDHVSRRHEEFYFGWINMPDDWSIFLIRLAAARCGLDLNGTCVFVHPNPNLDSIFSSAPTLESAYEAGLLVYTVDMSESPQVKVEVPVMLVLFKMFSKIRIASKGSHGECSKRQLYGFLGYYTDLFAPFLYAIVAVLPTIVRWQLMDDFDSWSPNWAEIMLMVTGGFQLFAGCTWINMVLSASSLLYIRRRILFDVLAGLVDGSCPGFGNWRLANTTAEASFVDTVRKLIACYDENYGRRATCTLGMLFVCVGISKIAVLVFFLLRNVTGEKWDVSSEPVLPCFLGLLPFIFALQIISALLAGTRLNEYAKLRVLAALDHRRRALIGVREGLVKEGASDIHERRLECVQQAFAALAEHVKTQQKPMVLLGWSGRGILELNWSKVLSYISESVLHVGMLLQVCRF